MTIDTDHWSVFIQDLWGYGTWRNLLFHFHWNDWPWELRTIFFVDSRIQVPDPKLVCMQPRIYSGIGSSMKRFTDDPCPTPPFGEPAQTSLQSVHPVLYLGPAQKKRLLWTVEGSENSIWPLCPKTCPRPPSWNKAEAHIGADIACPQRYH